MKERIFFVLVVCIGVVTAQDVGTIAGQPLFRFAPIGLALDPANGALYISDASNVIHRYWPNNGTQSVVVGAGCNQAYKDGIGTAGRLSWPNDVALDSARGVLYIADTNNHAIRSVVLSNESMSNVAGSNIVYNNQISPGYGFVDAVGTEARFSHPLAVVVDESKGSLYVADYGNCAIRHVVLSSRNVTTIFKEESGYYCPYGLALDYSAGILYLIDGWGFRKIFLTNMSSPVTVISMDVGSDRGMLHGMALDTEAGLLYVALNAGVVKKIVLRNNTMVTIATITRPRGLALDAAAGMLYVASYDVVASLHMVSLSNESVKTLLQESSGAGFADGIGSLAQFEEPQGLAVDAAARLIFVADTNNNAVRTVDLSNRNVSTLAGSKGNSGFIDGDLTVARFSTPHGLAFHDGVLYVADTGNRAIRKIDIISGTVSTVAGVNTSGYVDGVGSAARFSSPRGVALDVSAGVLYVADSGNRAIRRVDVISGTVSFFAGVNTSGHVSGAFSSPWGLAFDAVGVVYVADGGSHAIYRILTSNGSVSTLAGLPGTYDYKDGVGTSSRFHGPLSLALNAAAGVLYVADTDNFVIRSIILGSRTVSTLAGEFECYSPRDGIGNAAMFSRTNAIALDVNASVVYVLDSNAIRNVTIIPCAPGTSLGTTAPPKCVACAPGSYAALPSQMSCTPCAVGTYTTDVGRNTSCVGCPVGTYNPLTGQSLCTPCPAGTWHGATGRTSSSSCTTCASGRYCPGDRTSVLCGIGFYNTLTGQTSSSACIPCTPGTFASVTGQASCTPCSTGTYSSDVGRNTSCIGCPAGTQNPITGQLTSTACVTCAPGTWSAVGAAACTSSQCTAGYYCPGNRTIVPCPAGTYGAVTGLTSRDDCTPCAPGTRNPRFGSFSAADCRLCAPGFYGPAAGLPSCVACPVGYFSPGSGSISCQPCADSYFTNTTGSSSCELCPAGTFGSTLATAQAFCTPCPAGFFSPTTGGMRCIACSHGYSQPLTGQSDCVSCKPGTYAASVAQVECSPCAPHTASIEIALTSGCPACPSGQYQPSQGQQSCLQCDTAIAQLPTFTLDSGSITATACMPLSKTLVLNWGLFQAAQVGPAISVVPADGDSVPSWLSIEVVQGAFITLSSLEVPIDAADFQAGVATGTRWASSRVFNVTVKHMCRPTPFVTQFTLTITATLPSFTNFAVSANACPDFLMQLALSVGSCAPRLTAVVMEAQVADGRTSALVHAPAYVQMSLAGGMVTLFGTVPSDASPTLSLIVVVKLFGLVAATSQILSVTRTSGTAANVPVFAPPDQLTVRACPIVAVTFRAQLAPCGQTVLSVGILNERSNTVNPLPAFLRADQLDGKSMQVSGVVPEGTPTFRIVASAAVLGSSSHDTYHSTPVEVVRPATTAAVNLSLSLLGRLMWSTNATVRHENVEALYGARQEIAAQITFAGGESCTSAFFVVSPSAALLENSTISIVDSANGQVALPPWMSLTLSASGSSLMISGSLPKDFPLGTQWSFCVRAFDGQFNPTFCFKITASLSLRATVSHGDNAALVVIATPSPLLSISLQLPHEATQETLVCPSGGSGAAICSYDAASRSLGVFGTASGVNALLLRLRLATTRSNASLSQISQQVALLASDTVNPATLTLQLPLTAFSVYAGVSQTAQLPVVSALVGIEAILELAGYFSSGFGSEAMTFSFAGDRRFLQLDGSTLKGTAEDAVGIMSVQVMVVDTYTSLIATVTVNVTNPLPPQLAPGALKSWRHVVASGDTITFAFPQAVFSEPQGGVLNFVARQQLNDLSVLQPLPLFLQFDPTTLQLSGSPQVPDVGTYDLRIIAISRYGPWQGNVSAPVTVVVEVSWGDFFETIYTYLGFVLSGLSLLTALLVYRSSLRNMLTSRSWLRENPPTTLLHAFGGRMICRKTSNDAPIKPSEMSAIRISPLHCSASKWLPIYLRLQLEKVADLPETTCAGRGVSVPWISVHYHRDDTAELSVDQNLVERLIRTGDLVETDRFLVEVTARGWLCDGFLLEAFVFNVRDVYSLNEASLRHEEEERLSSVPIESAQSEQRKLADATEKLDVISDEPAQRVSTPALPKVEIDLL